MLILILGMILRNERLKNNLTLEELSKLTNISESELDKIELGKIKTPSSVFLFRLSKVLNLDYNEMLKYRFASYYKKKGILNA